MLEGIGTIGSYLQMQDLRLQAKTMFAAIQDEWKKFVNSEDYDALPESALDALTPGTEERRRASGKAPYRTTARQALAAAERYRLQGDGTAVEGAAGIHVDITAQDATGAQ